MKKRIKSTETIACKYCGDEVKKAYDDVVAVTCWKCTHKLVEGEELEIRK